MPKLFPLNALHTSSCTSECQQAAVNWHLFGWMSMVCCLSSALARQGSVQSKASRSKWCLPKIFRRHHMGCTALWEQQLPRIQSQQARQGHRSLAAAAFATIYELCEDSQLLSGMPLYETVWLDARGSSDQRLLPAQSCQQHICMHTQISLSDRRVIQKRAKASPDCKPALDMRQRHTSAGLVSARAVQPAMGRHLVSQ